MKTRNTLMGLLLAGSALLVAAPSFAQGDWRSGPHPAMRAHPAARAHFVGHPFHAVVAAHVDFAHFTPAQHALWVRGTWRHTWWHGRYGWWWNVGGVAFWYDAPVYPYPTVVSDNYYEDPADTADQDDGGQYGGDQYGGQQYGGPGGGQYWYYCQHPAGYYPYVRKCKGQWEPVPATPEGSQGPDMQGGPGDEQGPPPGYGGEQGPPPGYGGEQGPPPGQGPGPGDEQGPPPGYDQGPPPGYNQGPPN